MLCLVKVGSYRQHESQRASVNDESKTANHKPGENSTNHPVFPSRRQSSQCLFKLVVLVLADLISDTLAVGNFGLHDVVAVDLILGSNIGLKTNQDLNVARTVLSHHQRLTLLL